MNRSSKWTAARNLISRQFGNQNNYNFQCLAYSGLQFIQRLQLDKKLEHHDGCVNALNFSPCGTFLASGSDDLNIVLWDWAKGKEHHVIETGHRSNVFQSKFLPLSSGINIVSCARDGQVRLSQISNSGSGQPSRKIANHRGAAHKLAIAPNSSYVFLSCGEDSLVQLVDVRQEKPIKLLTCRNERNNKVGLYTIDINPTNEFEFAVAGRDQYARIYDRRKIDSNEIDPVKKFSPHFFMNRSYAHRPNITCLVYSYDGSELLLSYNDDDIYLFDSSHSDGAEYIKRYTGHQNNATVKGVNFFGLKSEYVVSGSDCGHIFFWHKESEEIVQCVVGDKTGAVNVLEPHPSICMLATSGIDSDVKLWTPTSNKRNDLASLDSVNIYFI
ncbi:uncharacterized protein TRIADDRAFT_23787 [Trichoplax adhaerens]|uniref:Uncharacterized protein n=1 Tax=Trichoplax adhaerens TaxID=10228 RepID=B3RTV5_TRIAD|nr:hypothetical protein TRIADDRAFT_23787 [Trichoplax adhaerens]EDV25690.1 hypothetical protein TRIADDRAFT_23787 [Trichoplax adhaerens]|eukprot:XP_002111723.1 hypothetical protein TRIADDRAFT_23787 [Trichoplax adhaerens]